MNPAPAVRKLLPLNSVCCLETIDAQDNFTFIFLLIIFTLFVKKITKITKIVGCHVKLEFPKTKFVIPHNYKTSINGLILISLHC